MGLSDDDKEVTEKGWHIVEKNQARISNLVMDMLAFSKEREPQMVPSRLNDVVEDVVELMHSRTEELGVALSWQGVTEMPELLFDPEGMHRAVLNVVTNALDACEDVQEGKVGVTTEYDKKQKVIRAVVEDNGSGISPDQIEKMFTLFVSSKGSRGTGLGLSVSQKICKEHGGQILVESELGKGSRFVLEIPALIPPIEQAVPHDDGSSVRQPQTS
jgi:signal transduction histidine kinase